LETAHPDGRGIAGIAPHHFVASEAIFPVSHPPEKPQVNTGDRNIGVFDVPDGKPVTAGRLQTLAHIELVASSFGSFREVGRFQQALERLPNVGNIRVRHLSQGALQVRVECRNTADLLQSLSRTYTRPFDVVSREPYRVEIVLRDSIPRESLQ
jgi:hypothetical protein